jgi:hypothetical protein
LDAEENAQENAESKRGLGCSFGRDCCFYNTTPKKAFKGFSLFELTCGFAPRFLDQNMSRSQAFEKYITARQDLFLRTQEVLQDVIAEKSRISAKINENQDRLPSRALFHKDDLVFLDKPSKLGPRYWGPCIVADVLPLNALKIRYDQGEEIVNSATLVKYNPRMVSNIKELSASDTQLNPKIREPSY